MENVTIPPTQAPLSLVSTPSCFKSSRSAFGNIDDEIINGNTNGGSNGRGSLNTESGNSDVINGGDNSDSSDDIGDDAKRVYVGNLPYSTSWQDLKDHMRQGGGEVLWAEVAYGLNGRSRGFGIVMFATAVDAHSAIECLHDSEIEGRLVVVRLDNQKQKQQQQQQQQQQRRQLRRRV